MRGRYKRKETSERRDADFGAGLGPPPETPAAGPGGTHAPVPGFPKTGTVDVECCCVKLSS